MQRLNYLHENPFKAGIVGNAQVYNTAAQLIIMKIDQPYYQ
jgi:hypothetical protein